MSRHLATHDPQSGARIGPNAVTQTLRALTQREGKGTAHRVLERSGVPSFSPDGLIPEAWFLELIDALRSTVSDESAEVVLSDSGGFTAAYVAAHRIPRPVRWLLPKLPPRLALPIMLRAFAAHAWTFAGSGTFEVEGPYPGTIVLRHAPTCRARPGRDEEPGRGLRGAYYEAAFEGLLSLAAPGVRVREIACEAAGADGCRFAITLSPRSGGADSKGLA